MLCIRKGELVTARVDQFDLVITKKLFWNGENNYSGMESENYC